MAQEIRGGYVVNYFDHEAQKVLYWYPSAQGVNDWTETFALATRFARNWHANEMARRLASENPDRKPIVARAV